jgi:S1-C subfamily serine protease
MKYLVAVFMLLAVTGCTTPQDSIIMLEGSGGCGSAFIVAQRDGWTYAMTARHVTSYFNNMKMSFTADGQPAEFVKDSTTADVALVRFHAVKAYHIFTFVDATLDQEVHAYGWTIEEGKKVFFCYHGAISCIDYTENMYVYNGGLVPGMSGGPVLNSMNQVVGINTAVGSIFGSFVPNLSLLTPSRFARYFLKEALP